MITDKKRLMEEGLRVKKSSLLFCSQSFVVIIFIVVREDIAVLFPFVWWDVKISFSLLSLRKSQSKHFPTKFGQMNHFTERNLTTSTKDFRA